MTRCAVCGLHNGVGPHGPEGWNPYVGFPEHPFDPAISAETVRQLRADALALAQFICDLGRRRGARQTWIPAKVDADGERRKGLVFANAAASSRSPEVKAKREAAAAARRAKLGAPTPTPAPSGCATGSPKCSASPRNRTRGGEPLENAESRRP